MLHLTEMYNMYQVPYSSILGYASLGSHNNKKLLSSVVSSEYFLVKLRWHVKFCITCVTQCAILVNDN